MAKRSVKSVPAPVSTPASSTQSEVAGFGSDPIAAAVKSNAALSAGLEAIGQEVALYARVAFENAGETARGLLGARTFEDVLRLQTAFAKRSVDGLIERTAKLSQLGCALFGASVGAWTDRAKP